MPAMILALVLGQTDSAHAPLMNAPGVYGVGARSCRQWTIYKTDKDARIAEEQWLGGYVSGVNFVEALDGVSEFIRDTDRFDDLIGVVDDFCSTHPLEGVDAAGRELVRQLMKRRIGPEK